MKSDGVSGGGSRDDGDGDDKGVNYADHFHHVPELLLLF